MIDSLSWDEVQHWATLLQHLPVAVIATDETGVVELWTEGATQLFGWSAAEAIGRPVTDLTVGPSEQRVADDIIGRVMALNVYERRRIAVLAVLTTIVALVVAAVGGSGGGTEAPEPIGQYTLFHMVGDMAELVKTLGESKAVIVSNDWGAPVAWHAALWRPDLFPAVFGIARMAGWSAHAIEQAAANAAKRNMRVPSAVERSSERKG
mgnify:CR=1 FL=1